MPAASAFQLAEKKVRPILEIPCLDKAIATVEPIIRKYVIYFNT